MKNHTRTGGRRSVRQLGACAALIATSVATTAAAQPDPFDDYARWRAGEAPEPLEPSPSASDAPVIETGQWTWSVGARSQLSFGWSAYERQEGDDGNVTDLFFRLTPEVNTFVWDRVQMGLNAGLYSKRAANTPGDSTSETGMLIELTGYYYAPISPRFSLVPGVGLGGYFGAGSRTLTSGTGDAALEVEDTTRTGGFSVAVYAGIAYQLLDELQLRSGLAFNALLGVESIGAPSQTFGSYTTHIGVPIELYFDF